MDLRVSSLLLAPFLAPTLADLTSAPTLSISLADKTAEFSNQIEIHQQELEPWTAKISDKQAGVDVASSERELLVEKASGMREAIVEAETALEKLKGGGQDKVSSDRVRQFEPSS